MDDILAFSLAALFTDWVWPILWFALGLGLVIFVHEGGHFLAARAVGIKVERFALGFGPRLFGYRGKETDYCVNAIPFGGYVKMLGQEDFKPLEEGQGDPRAYNNKSVGARFLVISAGVVMNVVLAAVLFVIIALVGKSFIAPIVGYTLPGFPASEVQIAWQHPTGGDTAPTTRPADSIGLQEGDRLVALDGDELSRFDLLKMKAVLAPRDRQFELTVAREIDGQEWIGTTQLGVRSMPEGTLGFGIAPAMGTELYVLDSDETPFKTGDRIVAVAGTPIEHHWDISRLQDAFDATPVPVTVERATGEGETQTLTADVRPSLRSRSAVLYDRRGERIEGAIVIDGDANRMIRTPAGEDMERKTAEVYSAGSDLMLDLLGLVPRLKVDSIAGGPAESADLEPGDILVNYGDRGAPTFRDLRYWNREFVNQETPLVVLRDGQRVTTSIRPTEKDGQILLGIRPLPDLEHPVIASVRPGSPAAQAGILADSTIAGVEVSDPNGGPPARHAVSNWYDLFQVLRTSQGRDLSLVLLVGGEEQTVEIGTLTPEVFDPADYELALFGAGSSAVLLPVSVTVQMSNPLKALAWGVRETGRFILMTYASLRSLFTGTVPLTGTMGPVGIGGLAISAARQGVIEFIWLLAFLSATIAVFNFLPIPVVDGGHAVFLLIEKVRGRPLPVQVMNIIQVAGLVLLLGVFVAVTFNDIRRLIW